MARITTPVPGYSGQGPGNLHFADGEAETDDEAIIAYCRQAGYGIDGEQPPARTQPEPADPREVTTVVVGSPTRDAAVDPRPADFQPPIGAGEANPHGPDVVAPGLPGGGLQPTAPPAPAAAAEGQDAGPSTPAPAPSAPVAEWRAWVIASQVDNDPEVHAEIEKATKAELIKKYGGN